MTSMSTFSAGRSHSADISLPVLVATSPTFWNTDFLLGRPFEQISALVPETVMG